MRGMSHGKAQRPGRAGCGGDGLDQNEEGWYGVDRNGKGEAGPQGCDGTKLGAPIWEERSLLAS